MFLEVFDTAYMSGAKILVNNFGERRITKRCRNFYLLTEIRESSLLVCLKVFGTKKLCETEVSRFFIEIVLSEKTEIFRRGGVLSF